MRCSDLRMGLAAVTVFLPVVLTAAYGITKGDNAAAENQTTVAAQALQPVAALARPSAAPVAPVVIVPLTLTAASDVATATPVAATDAASATTLHEAHATHHHPAKGHHPHRAG